MNKYSSVFSDEITNFLEHTKNSGFDIRAYVTVLNKLDIVLCELNISEKKLTRETIMIFEESFDVRPNCLYNYISHYRLFAQYLNDLGYEAFIPELPKYQFDYTPYIFSNEELSKIFEVADNLTIRRCPLYSLQMPVLLRILYGCGLRLSEALNLLIRDVDLENGILYVHVSKNKKHRMVPIESTLLSILKDYISVCGYTADDYLFKGQKNSQWNMDSVENCFMHILNELNIHTPKERSNDRGPCLHCLRHTFVLNSLKITHIRGLSFEEAAPFLSTYLGHSSINETDKYLRFSYELYDEAIEKVNDYTNSFFPEVSI